jgi:hypothetical protein
MTTLLERSKGSVLDIIAIRDPIAMDTVRAETLTLLSPHTQRIGALKFTDSYWSDIQEFSDVTSGPLPLLRTLNIDIFYERHWPMMAPPSLPLFTGAVNLKEFHLRSGGLPFLDHFIFPNLTILDLSVIPGEGFPVSQLLNFLEASPTLRTVHLAVGVLLEDVPPGRVVVLPNAGEFKLLISKIEPSCEVAAHITCPSARLASLSYRQGAQELMYPNIFPTSIAWNAIAGQYTASPVEEVMLAIAAIENSIIVCFLTFLSPGPAVLRLGFKGSKRDDIYMALGDRHVGIFSRASMTIRTHPLLLNIKRLRIRDRDATVNSNEPTRIAGDIKQLFQSMGPLDTLSLDVFDLRPYLAHPDGFPPIKGLTLAQPSQAPAKEECMAAVVELAKSQHVLGVPFKRVTIYMKDHPPGMEEQLRQWVDKVYCRAEVGT